MIQFCFEQILDDKNQMVNRYDCMNEYENGKDKLNLL